MTKQISPHLILAGALFLLLSSVQVSSYAEGSDDVIYLPSLQFNLTPPPTSISYYIEDLSTGAMWDRGCELGEMMRDYDESYIFSALQFGNPQTEDGVYGVNIYGFTFPFHSLEEVEDAAYSFALSYGYCVGSSSTAPWLLLGIGVNNQGGDVTILHGIEWGRVVDNVNARLDLSPVGYKVYALAGGDLELAFNEPSQTRNWVNGVLNSPTVSLYNYGTAGGCPAIDVPGTFDGDCSAFSSFCSGGQCTWAQSDVWSISVGQGRIRMVPQIYSTDGRNAQQWYQMALYGFRTNQLREMIFRGVFTQYQACQQVIDPDCEFLDNLPFEGWEQLMVALRQDDRTIQDVPYSADIQWQNQ